MKQIALVVIAALGCTGLASASLIPTLAGGSPTVAAPGVWQWSYTAAVSADEQLNPTQTATNCTGGTAACGTYFTIYDIPGFLSAPPPPGATAPAAPTDWTAQYQLVGLTPSTQNVPDSPGLMNVSYVYTGATTLGPATFSGFTFDSSFGNINPDGFYSYQSTKNSPLGTDQGDGPVSIPGGANVVPEPASMLLIGVGLIGLAVLRRKLAS